MQAAGNLVGVLVEFSAGVELGHDDLGGGHAFALVDVGRNAAPVVAHRAGTVGVERDDDGFCVAGEGLVDRVIDDLVDHVVQAGTVVGVADIHARPLTDGVEALEDLDRFRVVIGRIGRGGFPGEFGHARGLSRAAKCGWRIKLSCTPKRPSVQAKSVAIKILLNHDFSRFWATHKGLDLGGLFETLRGGVRNGDQGSNSATKKPRGPRFRQPL